MENILTRANENLIDFFTCDRNYFIISDGFNRLLIGISHSTIDIDKFLRKFSKPLTEEEKDRRISVARQIASFLKSEDPGDQISGIYLFGSTEKRTDFRC